MGVTPHLKSEERLGFCRNVTNASLCRVRVVHNAQRRMDTCFLYNRKQTPTDPAAGSFERHEMQGAR
jgi:hypothetical protein